MCLEVSGAEVARPYVERAHPEHPSLIDVAHVMDSAFGVTNIPNALWIDEEGVIVRPAEPAWSGAKVAMPAIKADDDEPDPRRRELGELVASRIVIDRRRYAPAVRDWAANGPASPFVLTPDQVVARSQPRPAGVSAAAAHFELGQHLWLAGVRDAALAHFNEAHRLQPQNWTYKRQAYSLIGAETAEGPGARFQQWPAPGHEAEWPFDSDYVEDLRVTGPGEYFPDSL